MPALQRGSDCNQVFVTTTENNEGLMKVMESLNLSCLTFYPASYFVNYSQPVYARISSSPHIWNEDLIFSSAVSVRLPKSSPGGGLYIYLWKAWYDVRSHVSGVRQSTNSILEWNYIMFVVRFFFLQKCKANSLKCLLI